MLAVVVAAGLLASRADRAIRPPRAVRDALPAESAPPSLELPLFDEPCLGPRVLGGEGLPAPWRGAVVQVCATEQGDVGIRQDQPTEALVAAIYAIPGQVHVGGPLGRDQGTLLYRDDGALRWTTSHRRARELSRGALIGGLVGRSPEELPRLSFGHTAWAPGELDAALAAGAWALDQSSR